MEATTHKLNKHPIFLPLLSQQGWMYYHPSSSQLELEALYTPQPFECLQEFHISTN